jgi:hypothetical protein
LEVFELLYVLLIVAYVRVIKIGFYGMVAVGRGSVVVKKLKKK